MSDHGSGSGSHESLRAYGTAHDLAEEAERLPVDVGALLAEAKGAVIVAARDGAMSREAAARICQRLSAVDAELAAVARKMVAESADARKGAK